VAILNQGQIMDLGTPDYLKSKIHGDIIIKVRVKNPEDVDKDRIMGFDSVEKVDLTGNEFMISLKSRDSIADVMSIFGEDILSVNSKEPSLDDVFIQALIK
jgi:ABC-2 type transport system ATP-binding protein